MTSVTNGIYLGSRGADFKNMIMTLLNRGNLKAKYIEILTNSNSMEYYGHAFTSRTADPVNNYERFEQIGDVTANKFIVWYSYRRFPQLDCTAGVKVVARLRINYGAKQFFGPLGEKLGFWPFISAAEEGTERNQYYRNLNKKDLLEDCVESFIGCTEYLLDNFFRPGVGYAIVYDILSSIFDEIDMSLAYEDLYDSKTRLKETFDLFKEQLGGWYFLDVRQELDYGHTIATSRLYQIPVGSYNEPLKRSIRGQQESIIEPRPDWVLIGTGNASKKNDAQQQAAERGILTLKANGYYKNPPKEYSYFCNF